MVVGGELPDGTHGFAAVNDLGQLVKLDTICFGQKGNSRYTIRDPKPGYLWGPYPEAARHRWLWPRGDRCDDWQLWAL